MVKKSENLKKSQKITFFQKKKNCWKKKKKSPKKKEKKCYPLSFPILGWRNSTRALQSSTFQNPGGGPLSMTNKGRRKSLCLILDSSLFNPILERRSAVLLLLLCHAQGTPPGFWNGVDWRALVESHPPYIGKLRK